MNDTHGMGAMCLSVCVREVRKKRLEIVQEIVQQ